MIPLMFAAISGGLLTGSAMAPFGAVAAVIAAPFGGSLCAVLAAFYVARGRGSEWQSPADLDEQTDAMVAALRGLAAEAKRETASGSEQAEDGDRKRMA